MKQKQLIKELDVPVFEVKVGPCRPTASELLTPPIQAVRRMYHKYTEMRIANGKRERDDYYKND